MSKEFENQPKQEKKIILPSKEDLLKLGIKEKPKREPATQEDYIAFCLEGIDNCVKNIRLSELTHKHLCEREEIRINKYKHSLMKMANYKQLNFKLDYFRIITKVNNQEMIEMGYEINKKSKVGFAPNNKK